MACNKYTFKGIEYNSLEELRESVKEQLKSKSSNNLDSNIIPVGFEGVMLIPDMLTRFTVKFSGELEQSLGISEGRFNYNELLQIIEKNINLEEGQFAEDILNSLLNDGEAYLTRVIQIHLPNIPYSYTKTFYGYNLEGLSSDTIIEARSSNIDINPIVGTKAYIDKLMATRYNGIAFEFSVIDKKIDAAKNLDSYDYVLINEDDGVVTSVKDTKEFTSLWEFENKKPKFNGKFSNDIVILYLTNRGFSKEDVKIFIDNYKETSVLDIKLNKGIIRFLNDFNVELSENLSNTDKEAKINKAAYDSKVTNKGMSFRSYFRSKLEARIVNDGYKFKPSEVVAPLPNLSLLGVDMNDSMETIDNDKDYFKRRLEETNYKENVPGFKGYLDVKYYTAYTLQIAINKIQGSGKFEGWDNWFDKLPNELYDILKMFHDGEITEEVMSAKALKAIDNTVDNMYTQIAQSRRKAYEKSKLIITSRIPSQAKQSTSFSVIVQIDNSLHSGLWESHTNFIIKGQDNDGDKLNTMFVQLDKHGRIISYDKYLDANGNFEGYDINTLSDLVEFQAVVLLQAKINTAHEKNKKKAIALYGSVRNILEGSDSKAKKDTINKLLASDEFKFKVNENGQALIDSEESRFLNMIGQSKASVALRNELNEVLNLTDLGVIETLRKISPNDPKFKESRKRILDIEDKVKEKKKVILNRYRAALKNYILDQQIKIYNDPKTAIEKEIPVDNVITKSIVDNENINTVAKQEDSNSVESFSDNNKITHNTDLKDFTSAEYVIHQGDTQIPVVANFIRLTNMFKEVASQLDAGHRDQYELSNAIDMSYYMPKYVDGELTYVKKDVILTKPVSFNEINVEDSLDKFYTDVHNVTDDDTSIDDIIAYNNHVNIVTSSTEELESFMNNNNIDKDVMTILDENLGYSKEKFIDFLYNQQIWEDLSEIMTGAVDNAKLLVLTRLGIDTTNIKYALTMLSFGVSIRDVVAILRQGDIVKAQNKVKVSKNINGDHDKAFKTALGEVAKDKESKNRKIAYSLNMMKRKQLEVVSFDVVRNFVNRGISSNPLNLMSAQNIELENLRTRISDSDETIGASIGTEQLVSKSSNSIQDVLEDTINEGIDRASMILMFVPAIDKMTFDKSSDVIYKSGKDIFLIDDKGRVASVVDGNVIELYDASEYLFLQGDVFIYQHQNARVNLTSFISKNTNRLINVRNSSEQPIVDANTDIVSFKNSLISEIDNSQEQKYKTISEDDSESIEKLEEYDLEHNPAIKMLELHNLVKELGVPLAVMSFKNGKNNNASDMKNYLLRIEKSVNDIFKNVGVQKYNFDVLKFVTDDKYKLKVIGDYESKKIGFNPLQFILQVTDLRHYLETLVRQEMVIRMSDNKTTVIDILHKKLFADNPISNADYRMLGNSIQSFFIHNYLNSEFNSLKSFTMDTGKTKKKYNLTTKEGQNAFVLDMPGYISYLKNSKRELIGKDDSKGIKRKYIKDNILINKIGNVGQSNEEHGPNTTFLGLNINTKNNAPLMASLKAAAEELAENNKALYDALFVYDMLVSGGSFSTKSIGNILGSKPTIEYDKSLNNGVLNYDDVSDVDLNYLMLLNPSFFKTIDKNTKRKLNVKMDSYGIITARMDIDGKKLDVPLTKDKLRQTGNELIKVNENNINSFDIYKKAGYTVGNKVNVVYNSVNYQGQLLGYNGKNYVVELSINDNNKKRVEFSSELMTKWNDETFIFKGYRFGPRSVFKEVLESEVKVTVTAREKNSLSNGRILYKILGEETDLGKFADTYTKGDVIKVFDSANGTQYTLVYEGLIDSRSDDSRANFIKSLDKQSSGGFLNKKNDGKIYAYGKYIATQRVTDVVGFNYINATGAFNKDLHLLKHLDSKTDNRDTHLWSNTKNAAKINMATVGSKGQVLTKDRVYALRTIAVGLDWESVARTMGLLKGEGTERTKKIAREKLKSYMGVTNDMITPEGKKRNDALMNFFTATVEDLKKANAIDMAIIEAVPMSRSGANNTYSEMQLVEEMSDFESNLSDENGDTVILKSTNVDNISKANRLGADIRNVNEAPVDIHLTEQLKDDIDVLKGGTVNNSNIKSIDYESRSVQEDIGKAFDAINNSNVIVVETSKLSYVDDSSVINRINSKVPSTTNFNSFTKVAKSNGLRTPAEWIAKIEELTELKQKVNTNKALTDRELNVLSEYDTVVIDDPKQMIEDIDIFYSVSGTTEGYVSKTQRIFAEGQKAFLSLQLAKNVIEDKDKALYVYATFDKLWYKYDMPTGRFVLVKKIPRVNGEKVAYLGSGNTGLDAMLKLSSYDKSRYINPGFIYDNDFIVDDNAEPLVGTELKTDNYNPATLLLDKSDNNKEIKEAVVDDRRVFFIEKEVNSHLVKETIPYNSLLKLEGYSLNEYSDGVVTLESPSSNNVYIVDINSDLRDKYDGIGTKIDSKDILFKFSYGENDRLHAIRFGNVYKTNKRTFVKRGTSGKVNTELKEARESIQLFTENKVDVSEGIKMSMIDMVKDIKKHIKRNTDINEDDWYLGINSYVDFIVRLKKGIFDNYLPENYLIKDKLISMDQVLSDKKKAYTEQLRDSNKKYQLSMVSVESTIVDKSDLINYVKVFYDNKTLSGKQVFDINSNISQEEANSGGGFYYNEHPTNSEGVLIEPRNTAYGVTLFNDKRIEGSIRHVFEHAKKGNDTFYVEFKNIKDKNGNFIMLYPGVTYETIAKAYVKVLRGNKSNMEAVRDGKVVFNDEAAELINSTDGVYSLSDINNNKEYKLVDTFSEDTFNASFIIDFNNMKLGNSTLMDIWNEKLGLLNNTNIYATPTQNSKLLGLDSDAMQNEMDNLLISYFNANHDELVSFMMKLKGRNFFDFRKGNYSIEQSMANIINNINSIDFLYNKKIDELPSRLIGSKFAVLTETEIDKVMSSNNIGEESVYTDDNGNVYRVKIESSFDDLYNGENVNENIKRYNINLDNEYVNDLRETQGNGKLFIISASLFNSNLKLVSEERVQKGDIQNSDIVLNDNINEKSFAKATVMILPNIKQSVLTSNSLDTSESLKPYIDTFGNVLVTDVNKNDIVAIKSPYYGDLDTANKDNFYDAFRRFIPVLNNITNVNANIVLSGGVTFNEYVRQYVLNKGYKYDAKTGMYTKESVLDYTDTTELFKVKNDKFISIINNNEKGHSPMPMIMHKDQNSAQDYSSKGELQSYNHLSYDSIYMSGDKVPVDKATVLLKYFKPSDKSFVDNPDIRIYREAQERRTVLFIKLAIAFDLFEGEFDIVDDIDKSVNNLYNFLAKNDDAQEMFLQAQEGVISDNLFDDRISKAKKLSMIFDFTAINIYLKELKGIDLHKLSLGNSFSTLMDTFRYEKIHKKQRLIKSVLIKSDFDLKDLTALELFTFIHAIDPMVKFDKRGNSDFGSTLHKFAEQGIKGIELKDGSVSLFDVSEVFNQSNESIDIVGPEKSIDKVNKEAGSLIRSLARHEHTKGFISSISKTSRKNLPFSIDGDSIFFYRHDGVVETLNKKEDLFSFINLIKENVLFNALSDIGLENNYNLSLLNDSSSSHLKANIGSITKRKGLDTISAGELFFSSFIDVEPFNVSDNFVVGNIYTISDGQKDVYGIVLYDDSKNPIFVTEDGKIRSITNEGLSDTIVDTVAISDEGNNSNYAKPIQGDYTYLNYIIDGEVETVRGDIHVDISREAIDNEGNTYKFNYTLNLWEKSSSVVSKNKVSLSITNALVGPVENAKELSKYNSLMTENGMVIKLGKYKELVEGNKGEIYTYDKNDKNEKINEKVYKLQGRTVWVDTDDNSSFKFRADIESITIKGNNVESKRVSTKGIQLIVNKFKELYSEREIDVKSEQAIKEIFGKEASTKAAFIYRGSVIYNSDRLTLDSPVHEFGHLYMEYIKQSNPEMYAAIISKAFENTDLMTELNRTGNYDSYEAMAEEAIVIMMGYNSTDSMNTLVQDKSIWQSILDFFNEFFNGVFGTKNTVNEFNFDRIDMSLTDVIDTMTNDVLYNEKSIFNKMGYQERVIINNKSSNIPMEEKRGILVNKLISLGIIKIKPLENKLEVSSNKINC